MSLPIRRLIGLAERCVFGKQSVDSIHCGPARIREQVPSRTGHPLFRSYGAILPSSFCKTHSSTLGYSPHLPVSVSGTDTEETRYEVFLGSMIRVSCGPYGRPVHASRMAGMRICQHPTSTRLNLHPTGGRPFTSASPLRVKRLQAGTGILNLFSIAYALRPRLRIRLTLRRLTLLRKP